MYPYKWHSVLMSVGKRVSHCCRHSTCLGVWRTGGPHIHQYHQIVKVLRSIFTVSRSTQSPGPYIYIIKFSLYSLESVERPAGMYECQLRTNIWVQICTKNTYC